MIESVGANGILDRYQGLLRQLGIALRDRLSQDMWRLIGALGKGAKTAAEDLDSILGRLDEGILTIATLNGLIAENMTRGMGWRFLEIGRRIERGIAICSSIQNLLGERPERVELSVRMILEINDSLITHRRRFPMDSYTLAAVDVVLTDGLNPRALIYQLEMLRAELDGLIGHDPLAAEKQVVERQLQALRNTDPFMEVSVDRLKALNASVRACRADLTGLSDLISQSFFSHVNATQSVVLGMTGRVAS